MSPSQPIPRPTIRRLSLYLREVERAIEQGAESTSSRQLGMALGLADTQVRKDLARFGQFGHPGVGYSTSELAARLRTILGKDQAWNVAIIGAGKIGQAMMSYGRYGEEGFNVVAVFDRDPAKIGTLVSGHEVLAIEDAAATIKEMGIRLAILAVPAGVAQELADTIIGAGVRGLLNFAPIRLEVEEAVTVVSVDFTAALEELAFRMSLDSKEAFDESV
jgi:redox-sensing transcriptional repressor